MGERDLTTTTTNKRAATDFLELVVARRIDEAYAQYIDMKGKHHNTYFSAGFPTLKEAMIENHAKFPNTQIKIKHVLGDGDLVAVHSHVIMGLGEPGVAVVHLFRFENNKIVEMWDCGQELQKDSPNKDGAF